MENAVDREKVIKGLECCMVGDGHSPKCELCPYAAAGDETCQTMDDLFADAIALLKAQEPAKVEPKRIELANETKEWLDKMDAVDALGNIANICMDWDGYRTADGLGGLVNEIWAYARYCADRIAKAQGRWERVGSDDVICCSVCGVPMNKTRVCWPDGGSGYYYIATKYCPHCGARNEKGDCDG